MTLCHMQFKVNATDDKARSGLMTFSEWRGGYSGVYACWDLWDCQGS